MNKIGSYGMYQQNYYENTLQGKKEKEAAKTSKADKTGAGQVKLSSRAQKLLQELKRTYGNMDFMVADYESDEEAAEYLSRGNKEYSVLLDTETLEEMAADSKTKEKYLGLLDEATGKLTDLKKQLEEEGDGEEVASLGVSIGKDGEVSFFAELEKMSDKQRERIEKSKEAKQEEAAKEKKASSAKEQTKRTRITAKTTEELLRKIRSVDWDKVPEPQSVSGNKFDFSI